MQADALTKPPGESRFIELRKGILFANTPPPQKKKQFRIFSVKIVT